MIRLNKKYKKISSLLLGATYFALIFAFIIAVIGSNTAAQADVYDNILSGKYNIALEKTNDIGDNNNGDTKESDIVKLGSPINIVQYKDNVSIESIDAALQRDFTYTASNGETIDTILFFEWNTKILDIGGMTKAIPYIIHNETGEKIYGDLSEAATIFILNPPYIENNNNVHFNIEDKATIDGREWQARGLLEMVDLSAGGKISKLMFPLIYNGSKINTYEEGLYEVVFSGNTANIDLEHARQITKSSKATVDAISIENKEFWDKMSQYTKNLKRNRFFSSDKISEDGKNGATVELQGLIHEVDRSFIIKPGQNYKMPKDFLMSVAKHKKSVVRVDMGDNQWDFYGQDTDTLPVNYNMNLAAGRINSIDELAVEILGNVNYELLNFEFNGEFDYPAVFRTKTSLSPDKTLYMFSWNENTRELELIGNLKNDDDGYSSISLNAIKGVCIITDDLPPLIDNPNFNDKSTSIIPYKITSHTNYLESEIYSELEADIKSIGGNIETININNISNNSAQENPLRENDRQIVAAILLFLIFLLTLVVVINKLHKHRKNQITVTVGPQSSYYPATAYEYQYIDTTGEISKENSFSVQSESENYHEYSIPIEKTPLSKRELKKQKRLEKNEVKKLKKSAIAVETKNSDEVFLNLPSEVPDDVVDEKNLNVVLEIQDDAIFNTIKSIDIFDSNEIDKIPIIEDNPPDTNNIKIYANSKIKFANAPNLKDGSSPLKIINPKDTMVTNSQKSVLALIQNNFDFEKEKIIKNNIKQNNNLVSGFQDKNNAKLIENDLIKTNKQKVAKRKIIVSNVLNEEQNHIDDVNTVETEIELIEKIKQRLELKREEERKIELELQELEQQLKQEEKKSRNAILEKKTRLVKQDDVVDGEKKESRIDLTNRLEALERNQKIVKDISEHTMEFEKIFLNAKDILTNEGRKLVSEPTSADEKNVMKFKMAPTNDSIDSENENVSSI